MEKSKSNNRKQVGAVLNVDLYRQMRAAAALQGRTVSDALEDAMRQYLERHRSEQHR